MDIIIGLSNYRLYSRDVAVKSIHHHLLDDQLYRYRWSTIQQSHVINYSYPYPNHQQLVSAHHVVNVYSNHVSINVSDRALPSLNVQFATRVSSRRYREPCQSYHLPGSTVANQFHRILVGYVLHFRNDAPLR